MFNKLREYFAKLSPKDKGKIHKKAKDDLLNHQVNMDKVANDIEQLEKKIREHLAKLEDRSLSRIRKETISAKVREIHEVIQKKEKLFQFCRQQISSLSAMIHELDLSRQMTSEIGAKDYEEATKAIQEASDLYKGVLDAAQILKNESDASWDKIQENAQPDTHLEDIKEFYTDREKQADKIEDDLLDITRKYMIKE